MDNLTHSFIGLGVAKAGLERLSPGATALCVIAANIPDGDLIALIFGRWTYLHQHRGVSHSIVGVIVLAVALPLVFYLGDSWRARRSKAERRVKLSGLLLASLVATASHPLMDWTNNYGVRPLLPWNPSWFYGDFVFIIDPFIWIVLGGAGFLLTAKTRRRLIIWIVIALIPTTLVLVGAAGSRLVASSIALRVLWIAALIGIVALYRRDLGRKGGAKVAIAALATVAIYCTGLAITHRVALGQAKLEATAIANKNSENLLRVVAMPTLANPTEWISVMETDRAAYRFPVFLVGGPASPPGVIRYQKPEGLAAQAVAEAARERSASVFLDFARFPVVRVVGEDCVTQTLVQFADLRYTEPGRGRGTFALDVPVDCPALADRQK